MNKLITVICTVKNGENTISTTVESVLNQTYKNFEFIIINDGSVDSTVHILNSYKEKDDRIKLFDTTGIGRPQALNKALKNSKGELIANIDADDVFHPQKLEIQVKMFTECDDYFLISTRSKLIYDEEIPTWDRISVNEVFDFNIVTKKILIENQISHPSVMMKRKELIKLGGYNESRQSQVDYDLWLRAYTNKYKMLTINQKLVAKRIHKRQSYENKKRLKYTFNSSRLKMKYILINKKFHLSPLPIISFILGQLPFGIRRFISKVFL